MHIKLTDFGSAKLLDEDETPVSQAPPNEDVEEGKESHGDLKFLFFSS
jgi:hypothetical protein